MSTPPISRSKRRRTTVDGASVGKEEGKRALYHCNYCQRDISDGVRIKCAVCMDFDLCVECFSVGVELGDHKNTHAYCVMDYLAFPLFEPQWGADEEILFLEAIDMYGIGNWQAIAEHVGQKGAVECKAHYLWTYIDHPASPLPRTASELAHLDIRELMKQPVAASPSTGPPPRPDSKATKPAPAPVSAEPEITLTTTASGTLADANAPLADAEGSGRRKGGRTNSRKSGAATPAMATPAATAATMAPSGTAERGDATSAMSADDTDVVSGSGAAPTATDLPEPSGKVQEAPPSKPPTSGRLRDTIKHEATGYLKFRDEFDPEYDAEAELPIADLEFNADDAPHVRKAKLHMLELYAERLVERERRREVIKAKGLTDIRRLQAAEKRRCPFERRIYASMRVFERYQTPQEAEGLCQGIFYEQQLRARIEDLKTLRRLGARTFLQGDIVQNENAMREATQASGRGCSWAPLRASPQPRRAATGSVSGFPGGGGRGGAARPLQEERKRQEAVASGRPSGRPERHRTSLANDAAANIAAAEAAAAAAAAGGAGAGGAAALSGGGPPIGIAGGGGPVHVGIGPHAGKPIVVPTWRGRRPGSLDISQMPGVEALSEREAEVCCQHRFVPAHWLLLKETLMREVARSGPLSRNDAKTLFRLEPARATKLHDLAVSLGWVPAKGSATAAPSAAGTAIKTDEDMRP